MTNTLKDMIRHAHVKPSVSLRIFLTACTCVHAASHRARKRVFQAWTETSTSSSLCCVRCRYEAYVHNEISCIISPLVGRYCQLIAFRNAGKLVPDVNQRTGIGGQSSFPESNVKSVSGSSQHKNSGNSCYVQRKDAGGVRIGVHSSQGKDGSPSRHLFRGASSCTTFQRHAPTRTPMTWLERQFLPRHQAGRIMVHSQPFCAFSSTRGSFPSFTNQQPMRNQANIPYNCKLVEQAKLREHQRLQRIFHQRSSFREKCQTNFSIKVASGDPHAISVSEAQKKNKVFARKLQHPQNAAVETWKEAKICMQMLDDFESNVDV